MAIAFPEIWSYQVHDSFRLVRSDNFFGQASPAESSSKLTGRERQIEGGTVPSESKQRGDDEALVQWKRARHRPCERWRALAPSLIDEANKNLLTQLALFLQLLNQTKATL